MFKKSLIVFVLSLGLVLLNACSGPEGEKAPATDTPPATETPAEDTTADANDSPDYYNAEYGVELKNVVNWEKMEDKFGTLVAFISDQEDAEDDFRENVNLVVEEVPAGISIDEYAEAAHEQLDQVLGSFALVNEEKIDFLGQESYSHKYSFNQGEFDLEGMQIYFIKDDVAYILTYTAKKGSYDKYFPDADKIMQTLTVK